MYGQAIGGLFYVILRIKKRYLPGRSQQSRVSRHQHSLSHSNASSGTKSDFSITEGENLSHTKIFRTRYHNALYSGI